MPDNLFGNLVTNLNPELLMLLDFSKSFILCTDASKKAMGFTSMQEHDNELKPIKYWGRVSAETEYCYVATVKKLLAICFAVKREGEKRR